MKKLSLIVCGLLLALPRISSAQYVKGDQELYISYGRESGSDIISGFEFNRTPPNFDHPTYNSATAKTGNFFAGYSYFLTGRLAIGLTAGTEFVSFDHYANNDIPPAPGLSRASLLGSFKANITTAAFEIKPIYFNGRLIQLYGFLGVGGRYTSDKLVSGENNTPGKEVDPAPFFINTQWTPIGVHIGKTLSGFLELGVGYKGLINGGISYKPSHHTKAVAAKPE